MVCQRTLKENFHNLKDEPPDIKEQNYFHAKKTVVQKVSV